MDFKQVAKDFPIKQKMIYLNNASIGACSNRVKNAVDDFLTQVVESGRNNYPTWCKIAENEVKADIGKLLGAQKDEIAFIKNTTEGLVFVANGVDWKPGDNMLIAEMEYPSNVYCWLNLKRLGVEIRWIKNRGGKIAIDDVVALVDSRTRVISLSGVQFSNGFKLDLERVGDICKKNNVIFNLDMIQWWGAVDFDASKYNIDFASGGGHKWLLGPIGTGIFYCRRSSLEKIRVSSLGYHSIDKSEDHLDYDLTAFRPGAARFEEALVNFPGIWGLHAAVKTMLDLGMKNVEAHITKLDELAIDGLKKKGYKIISHRDPSERSGILSFNHPTVAPEQIVDRLQKANVHLAIRASGLRISPSIFNDEHDIAALIAALPQ
ncbi:MAG: aminotransferase class V-fold PLP-dependent enzyme [Planctomycetota bacterium]